MIMSSSLTVTTTSPALIQTNRRNELLIEAYAAHRHRV